MSGLLSVDRIHKWLRGLAGATALTGLFLLAGCGGDRQGDSPAGTTPGEQSEVVIDENEPAEAKTDPRELKALPPGFGRQSWLTPEGQVVNFVISIPDELTEGEPVPLVLALHFGADNSIFRRFFAEEFLRQFVLPGLKNVPALVVAPDAIHGTWTNETCETAVMSLMHKVCELYNIDRERILVTGYSMGGRGVWHLAQRHPDFFTAGLVLAGAPPRNYAELEWNVPMLCVQSVDDIVFPIDETRQAIEDLKPRYERLIQLFELHDISHYESAKFVEPMVTGMDWVLKVWESGGKTE